jgi:hypothetical protein
MNETHAIDRRFLLKLAGAVAAAGAIGIGAPRAAVRNLKQDAIDTARPSTQVEPVLLPPGMYQFSGTVRLQAPVVEISGISNVHQISWSPGALRSPMANFSSFEHFGQPWQMPTIRVQGGELEALAVVPLSFA